MVSDRQTSRHAPNWPCTVSARDGRGRLARDRRLRDACSRTLQQAPDNGGCRGEYGREVGFNDEELGLTERKTKSHPTRRSVGVPK